jgi:hypothetical protein
LQFYEYGDKIFNSAWALAVWIYYKDHEMPISMNTQTLPNSTCCPCFRTDNGLLEVKDAHFTYEEWLARLELYEKHKVELICGKDMPQYLDYIDETYGPKHLKSYRRKKNAQF